MKKYMHTLDGKPAFFDNKTKQIYFASRGTFGAVRLVDSVADIHRQERISARSRAKQFGSEAKKFEHGWMNVIVDI